ncbi:hypothetical protein ABID82_002790 [Methylobacterium sp. PvP062]|jgi:Family of unknown function (DUF6502)|uniref:Uncharacterized protein n=2 Tax=Methylobacterium radiotolerans TaxID=31998 RepID=B1LUU0_METRJ|nr:MULTISPECIES: DUF6502 family protein [Methylobacterium]MCX7331018.1 DUF6502 family protein [Hyphomicrobiales bacterium]GAN47538.1 hypothetical protein ME121_1546 [Methylobacterium sp. ME121]ACB25526.1 conserved hypothetical protein [Methylobacterium radiotolerans JCM 2831]KIU31328.1 hypothetical protein SR39_17930 [Methylobacterium radiotolerans]KTS06004.1 hypothetical protein SB3_21345 [Methylobacterium radiotolerans]
MSETADTPREGASLHAPLARLLRPLVRLLVARGITFPALTDLLRELYVNVAEYDFALTGKEQTDSRVSLLTGIHRKEVRRLRGAGAPVSAVPAVVSRTSRIIARWIADPTFTDPQGQPLKLPRTAEGGAPSFESLVAGVTRDLRPRAVLDEWLDRGLAFTDPQDRIVLAEAAYVPRGDGAEGPQLYYFGRNLHDHIAAAVANIVGDAPRFLERAVHYDGLSEDLAIRLEERAREIAMEALQQANREAHAACQTDPGGTHRWNFGLYVYTEAAPPARQADER